MKLKVPSHDRLGRDPYCRNGEGPSSPFGPPPAHHALCMVRAARGPLVSCHVVSSGCSSTLPSHQFQSISLSPKYHVVGAPVALALPPVVVVVLIVFLRPIINNVVMDPDPDAQSSCASYRCGIRNGPPGGVHPLSPSSWDSVDPLTSYVGWSRLRLVPKRSGVGSPVGRTCCITRYPRGRESTSCGT